MGFIGSTGCIGFRVLRLGFGFWVRVLGSGFQDYWV